MTYIEAKMWFIQEMECPITLSEQDVFSKALKAIERQIPKKPYEEKVRTNQFFCPNCSHWFDETYEVTFCPDCG